LCESFHVFKLISNDYIAQTSRVFSSLLNPPLSRPPNQISSIAVGLATRCYVKMCAANAAMKKVLVHEWGKVRRINSDEGDTLRSCSLGVVADDARDATYIRYEMLVDQNARYRS
ncbi:hypothetical protein C8J57DRAFT_1365580, partial [Mycena rebaudengoi]